MRTIPAIRQRSFRPHLGRVSHHLRKQANTGVEQRQSRTSPRQNKIADRDLPRDRPAITLHQHLRTGRRRSPHPARRPAMRPGLVERFSARAHQQARARIGRNRIKRARQNIRRITMPGPPPAGVSRLNGACRSQIAMSHALATKGHSPGPCPPGHACGPGNIRKDCEDGGGPGHGAASPSPLAGEGGERWRPRGG